jgi:hypothetical protein
MASAAQLHDLCLHRMLRQGEEPARAAKHFESTGHRTIQRHHERGTDWPCCRIGNTLLEAAPADQRCCHGPLGQRRRTTSGPEHEDVRFAACGPLTFSEAGGDPQASGGKEI